MASSTQTLTLEIQNQQARTNSIAIQTVNHCMATYTLLPLQTKYKIEQAPQLIGALAHLLNLNMFYLYHQIP
jgi:hypothetical protein